MVRCNVQSLGGVSSSPVYDVTTSRVVLTYDNGAVCNNGRKWHSIIAFICDEHQLQVSCCYSLLFVWLNTVLIELTSCVAR